MTGGGHRLGAMTSAELADRRPVLLVPVGATEQHGPHLPLDTDLRIATAVADAVAARHDGEVLVAPGLPYGSSGEHAGFPGTLSIGQAAVEQVLVELVRSAGDDHRLVVLVHGHGGNAEPAGRALAVLEAEGRPVAAWWPTFEDGLADAHAGATETSLLLHLAPDVVRLDRAEPGRTEPIAELLPALRAGGVAAVSPNGVLGDPTGASPVLGGILFDGLVDDLDILVTAQVAAREGKAGGDGRG